MVLAAPSFERNDALLGRLGPHLGRPPLALRGDPSDRPSVQLAQSWPPNHAQNIGRVGPKSGRMRRECGRNQQNLGPRSKRAPIRTHFTAVGPTRIEFGPTSNECGRKLAECRPILGVLVQNLDEIGARLWPRSANLVRIRPEFGQVFLRVRMRVFLFACACVCARAAVEPGIANRTRRRIGRNRPPLCRHRPQLIGIGQIWPNSA